MPRRLGSPRRRASTKVRIRLVTVVVLLGALIGFPTSDTQGATAPTGTIEGQIGVIRGNGDVVPGSRVSMWLHSRGLDVPAIIRKHSTDSSSETIQKIAILGMILEFTNLLGNQEYRKYQVATTTSNLYGEFTFSRLPTDRWYYVTAIYQTNFSTIVWHMPVLLRSHSRIELSNDNAALPIYNR